MLKTGVMMLKLQLCHHKNKLRFKNILKTPCGENLQFSICFKSNHVKIMMNFMPFSADLLSCSKLIFRRQLSDFEMVNVAFITISIYSEELSLTITHLDRVCFELTSFTVSMFKGHMSTQCHLQHKKTI